MSARLWIHHPIGHLPVYPSIEQCIMMFINEKVAVEPAKVAQNFENGD